MSKEAKKDANDYSRFENIEDSDAESVHDAKRPVNETMAAAANLKEEGNERFKKNDCAAAKMSYEDALHELREYKEAHVLAALPDPIKKDLTSLLVSIYGNLAMVCLKQENWAKALSHAGSALRLDGGHVKCLYRRGVAHRWVGELDEA
ncbi:hypothetical protein EON64_09310, partial [archaeon]